MCIWAGFFGLSLVLLFIAFVLLQKSKIVEKAVSADEEDNSFKSCDKLNTQALKIKKE